MRDIEKSISRNLSELLPAWLVHFLWFLYEEIEEDRRGSRQIFALKRTATGQYIRLTQQAPPYDRELHLPCPDAVTVRIFIVADGEKRRMLPAEEVPE